MTAAVHRRRLCQHCRLKPAVAIYSIPAPRAQLRLCVDCGEGFPRVAPLVQHEDGDA